jgi:hypothetical protein
MADNELSAKLNRRQNINEGQESPSAMASGNVFNPYTEFPEFSRKEIKDYKAMFQKYDTSKDGFIDLQELKYMMEKLGHPQTHVALKNMITEIDEDKDRMTFCLLFLFWFIVYYYFFFLLLLFLLLLLLLLLFRGDFLQGVPLDFQKGCQE